MSRCQTTSQFLEAQRWLFTDHVHLRDLVGAHSCSPEGKDNEYLMNYMQTPCWVNTHFPSLNLHENPQGWCSTPLCYRWGNWGSDRWHVWHVPWLVKVKLGCRAGSSGSKAQAISLGREQSAEGVRFLRFATIQSCSVLMGLPLGLWCRWYE